MRAGGVLSAVAAEDDFEGALNAFRRALKEEENEDEHLEDGGGDEIGLVGDKLSNDGLPSRMELVHDSKLSYELPLEELDEEDNLPEGWDEEMSSLGVEGLGSAEVGDHEGEHEAKLVYMDSEDADSARCCTSPCTFSNTYLTGRVGGEEGNREREFVEPAFLQTQHETGGANDAVLPVEPMSTSADELVAESICQVGVENYSSVSLLEVEEGGREAEGATESGEARTALSGKASPELPISPTPPEGCFSAMANPEYIQDTATDVNLEPNLEGLDGTFQPAWDSQLTSETAEPKIQEVEHARELELQQQGGYAFYAGKVLEPAIVGGTERGDEGKLLDPVPTENVDEISEVTGLLVESKGTFRKEQLAEGASRVGAERCTWATVPKVNDDYKEAESAGRPNEVHMEILSAASCELPITPELSEGSQLPSGAQHTPESAPDVNAETRQLPKGTTKLQDLVLAPEFAGLSGLSFHTGTQDAEHSSRQTNSKAGSSLNVFVSHKLDKAQDSAPKDHSLPMDMDVPRADHEAMLTMKSAVTEQNAVVQTSVEYEGSNMITGLNLDVEIRNNNNCSSWECLSASALGMTSLIRALPTVELCNSEQMLEKPAASPQVVQDILLQSAEHTVPLSTKSSSAIVHEDEDIQEVEFETHGDNTRDLPVDGDALDHNVVKDMLHPVRSSSPDKLSQCTNEIAAKRALAIGADDRQPHACRESSSVTSDGYMQEDSIVDKCPSELEARIHVDEGMAIHSTAYATHRFMQSSLDGDDSIQGSSLDGNVTKADTIASSMPGTLQAVECALPLTAVTLEGDCMPSKCDSELVRPVSNENDYAGSMPAPVTAGQRQQAQTTRGDCTAVLDLATSICSNYNCESYGHHAAGIASSSPTEMCYFLSNGEKHVEFQQQLPVAPDSSTAERDGSLTSVAGTSGEGVLPSTECQATVAVGEVVDVLPTTCGTLQDVEVLEPALHVPEAQAVNPVLADISAVRQVVPGMCYGRLNKESSTSQRDGVHDGLAETFDIASVGDKLAATPCEGTRGSMECMEQGSKSAFLKSVISVPLSKEGTVDDDYAQQGIEATAVCSSKLVEMPALPDDVTSERDGVSLHENQEAGSMSEMVDALPGVPADRQCVEQNGVSVVGNNVVGCAADSQCSVKVAESCYLVAAIRQHVEDLKVRKADCILEEEACLQQLPSTDETTFSWADDEMQLEVDNHGDATVVAGFEEDKCEVYVQKSTSLFGAESNGRRTCISEQQATGLDEINERAGRDIALGDKRHDRTGISKMCLVKVEGGTAQDADVDCSQVSSKQPGTDKGLVVEDEDLPSLDDAGRVHAHLKQQTNSKRAHAVPAVSQAYHLAEIEKSREMLRAEARRALAFECAKLDEVEEMTGLHKAIVDCRVVTASSFMDRETRQNVQGLGDQSSDIEDVPEADDPVSSLTQGLADVTKFERVVVDAGKRSGVEGTDRTTMSFWTKGEENTLTTESFNEVQDLFHVGSISHERGSGRRLDGATGTACKSPRCVEGDPATEALYPTVMDVERLDGEESTDTKLTLTVGLQRDRSNLQPFVHLQSFQGCFQTQNEILSLSSGNQLEGEDTSDTKLCLNSGLVGDIMKERNIILDLPMETGSASEEIPAATEVTVQKHSSEHADGPVPLGMAVGLDDSFELNNTGTADGVHEGISTTEDKNSDPGSLRSCAKDSKGAGPTLGNTLVYSELRALVDFVKAQSSLPDEVASAADDMIPSGPRVCDALSHQDMCPSDLGSDMTTICAEKTPYESVQSEGGMAKAVGENQHPLESTLIVDLQHPPTGGGVTMEVSKDVPISGILSVRTFQGDHGTVTGGGERQVFDISPSTQAPWSGMRGWTSTTPGTPRSQEMVESPPLPPANDSVTPSTRGVKRGAIFQTYKPRKRASKEPQQVPATNGADSLQASCPTRGGANDEQGTGATRSLTGPHEHLVAVGDLSSTTSWIPVEIPILQEKPKQRLKTLARKRVSDAESVPDDDRQPAKRSSSTSRTVPHHQPFDQSSSPPVVTPPSDVWPMRRVEHRPGVAGPTFSSAAIRTPLGAPLHTESDFANSETRWLGAQNGAANSHVLDAGLELHPDPPASWPFGPIVQSVHPSDSEGGVLPVVEDQSAAVQAHKVSKRQPRRKGQTVAGAISAAESPVAGGTELPGTNGRQKRQTPATGTGELNVSQLKQDVHRVRNIISRRLEALGSHCHLLQDVDTEGTVDLAATESCRHLIFSEDQREEFVQRVVKSCQSNSRTRTWFLGTVRKIASYGVMKDAASNILSEGHCETAEDVVTAWERRKSDPSDSHDSFLNLCHTVDELHKQGSGLFDGLVASEDTESSLLKRTEDGKWDLRIPPQVTKKTRGRRGLGSEK